MPQLQNEAIRPDGAGGRDPDDASAAGSAAANAAPAAPAAEEADGNAHSMGLGAGDRPLAGGGGSGEGGRGEGGTSGERVGGEGGARVLVGEIRPRGGAGAGAHRAGAASPAPAAAETAGSQGRRRGPVPASSGSRVDGARAGRLGHDGRPAVSGREDTVSLLVSLCILGFGLSLLFRFLYSEYLALVAMRRARSESSDADAEPQGKVRRRVSTEDFVKYR